MKAINGGTYRLDFSSPSGTILQDTWYTIIARYDASTLAAELRVNGAVVGTATASAALTDRTLTNTYVGKSNWADTDLNADMAGLLVVDQYLDLTTAVAHADSMEAGTHSAAGALICTSCPAGTPPSPPPSLPPTLPFLAAILYAWGDMSALLP